MTNPSFITRKLWPSNYYDLFTTFQDYLNHISEIFHMAMGHGTLALEPQNHLEIVGFIPTTKSQNWAYFQGSFHTIANCHSVDARKNHRTYHGRSYPKSDLERAAPPPFHEKLWMMLPWWWIKHQIHLTAPGTSSWAKLNWFSSLIFHKALWYNILN